MSGMLDLSRDEKDGTKLTESRVCGENVMDVSLLCGFE